MQAELTAMVKAGATREQIQRRARELQSDVFQAGPLDKVAKASVKYAGKAAQTAGGVASYVPGAGTIVGAGLKTVGAGLQGQNIAKAAIGAVKGAVPYVALAERAVATARDIASGKNVLKTIGNQAAQYAQTQVPGGEYAQAALRVASQAARGKNVIRAAASEAVTQAGRAAGQFVPSGLVSRETLNAVNRARAQVQQVQQVRQMAEPLQALRPGVTRPLITSGGQAVNRFTAARPIIASPRIARAAQSVAQRPLSAFAKKLVRRYSPLEVSGLTGDGKWLVEKGDTGSKIAKTLTGDANRWTELKAVNPTIMKSRASQVKQYGFPIYAGDLINLPAGWVKATTQTQATVPSGTTPSVTPATVLQTVQTVLAPAGDIGAQIQARATLAAWGKTDGATSAGLADYGGPSELGATSWTARDRLQAAGFQTWSKIKGVWAGATDGEWSQGLADALALWAEKKATQTFPTIAPVITAVAAATKPQVTETVPVATTTPVQTASQSTVPSITVPELVITPSGVAVGTGTEQAQAAPPSFWQRNKTSLLSIAGGLAATAGARYL